MKFLKQSEGSFRQSPAPNGPTVEVLFGGDGDTTDIGVIRITVPVGAAMPAHTHGGSDIVLMPQAGSVELTTDDASFDVQTGDAIFVDKNEAVALRNSGTTVAQLIVAAGPANFIAGVLQWPEPAE